jgi:hypothetical protein
MVFPLERRYLTILPSGLGRGPDSKRPGTVARSLLNLLQALSNFGGR